MQFRHNWQYNCSPNLSAVAIVIMWRCGLRCNEIYPQFQYNINNMFDTMHNSTGKWPTFAMCVQIGSRSTSYFMNCNRNVWLVARVWKMTPEMKSPLVVALEFMLRHGIWTPWAKKNCVTRGQVISIFDWYSRPFLVLASIAGGARGSSVFLININ